MKKFMKAIAFVTVMCLALSTVAFAAGTAPEKIFNVTVTEAGNDQVALYIVAEGGSLTDDPLYIDQKGAENGTAEFTAVLTNATVDAVDVYVGYATYAAGNTTPLYVGTVKLEEEVTEITVTKINAVEVERAEEGAESDYGYGFACGFNVTGVPSGCYAKQMVWAITYKVPGTETTRTVYSEAINVEEYRIGDVVDGNIKLGIAVANGSRLRPDVEEVTIESVDAIFLFNDADETVKTTDDTRHDEFMADKKQ